MRFGAMDVTKPYDFIWFGAMEVTKPYEFIGYGAMEVTKPYEFIGYGMFTPGSWPESAQNHRKMTVRSPGPPRGGRASP